ncbi:MAG: hypothetical protein ACOX1L_00490 [Erysipelotrichaceae bacterium]|jgi:hypothetical protein
MSYFGKFYLDKEKDIAVNLDMSKHILSYCLSTPNHKTDNLIVNLTKVLNQTTVYQDNRPVIKGTIPCFIKGDGQRVYVFRLNNTKIANIYPNGKVEINAIVPAISKTLMSQTKEYNIDIRNTLIKSYILEDIKLRTDLHTHGNANLTPDALIALGIKHQIDYPYYYIKKLNLKLSAGQYHMLEKQRAEVALTIDDAYLSQKRLNRKIDDNTFINFADLILLNLDNALENISKIRNSLAILKDSQAVFTNLEKLYLYRYVFTKPKISYYKIPLTNIEKLPDVYVYRYLVKMLKDFNNNNYRNLTFFEDKMLWIARSYQAQQIYYVEISDTTLVKKEQAAIDMLRQLHHILPLAKKETGVDIRFLAAIRRIPLTLVRDDIQSANYLTEAMSVLKIVSKDPYVVGSDFVGEEINDINELKSVIKEIVSTIASKDKYWTIRVHAGENDSLKDNMSKALKLIEDSLHENQPFPFVRIGHGVYSDDLNSIKGKRLLRTMKNNSVVLEFQITSNVRLNNLTDLSSHPLHTYLENNIKCVVGTDGCGLYGTDSIDEQLALMNLMKITDEQFRRMKMTEDEIINRSNEAFELKAKIFYRQLQDKSIEQYYTEQFENASSAQSEVKFEINKVPSYPIFKEKIKELPWDKFPVIIAASSFTTDDNAVKMTEFDRRLMRSMLNRLDPDKVFFVLGHKLLAHEKFLLANNKRNFDIYCIIPALMDKQQATQLEKADITGIRLSIESQEMGIYKSFNYEIFERRNSFLFAFDGNSAIANLVQEAKNGKGKTKTFINPKSATLQVKAKSLKGYVIPFDSVKQIVDAIVLDTYDIGTKR